MAERPFNSDCACLIFEVLFPGQPVFLGELDPVALGLRADRCSDVTLLHPVNNEELIS